jgi:hypothetical protein
MLLSQIYDLTKTKQKKSLKKMIYHGLILLIMDLLSPRILKREIEYFIRGLLGECVIQNVDSLKMLLVLKDGGIHRDLFVFGRREPIVVDYLLKSKILKEGDCVLDIGSNIGYYVLFLSKLVGGKVKFMRLNPCQKIFNL